MSIEGVEYRQRGQWCQPLKPVVDEVSGYSKEVRQAMKLLEPLLQANLLVIHPDRWSGNRLCFMRPRSAQMQGWKPQTPSLHAQPPIREKFSLWRVGGVKNFFRTWF